MTANKSTQTPRLVRIFCDGACRGNPGPGGWGVVMYYQQQRRELFGGEPHTTNNRMELTAAIKSLQALTQTCQVIITTDSKYVKQGMTEWIIQWKAKGWRNSRKQPVKNADLWQQLDALVMQHQVTWEWVKGHSGHPDNELADALANKGIDSLAIR